MALVRVFTPQSASEQAVVVAMLEAHEIPTLVHNGHLASLLPGVVINAYNSSSIMVPEECVEAAADLIADYRAAAPPRTTRDESGLVLRNLFEFLLGGWFVPQRSVAAPSGGLARFVAFHDAPESDRFRDEKLAFAVIVARHPEGILLVFNKFRRVWELPGGLIDPGEGARDTATRELREEAGCDARDVAWLGIIEVKDERTFFGGVFACDVDVVEFVENEEIGGLAYWQPDRPPPGMGATDEALLARFGR
jgi:8-oxo-dGTP diphosphatase